MKAELAKDGTLTLSGVPFDAKGRPSLSGKTMVHGTTGKSGQPVQINGRIVMAGLTLFSYPQ